MLIILFWSSGGIAPPPEVFRGFYRPHSVTTPDILSRGLEAIDEWRPAAVDDDGDE